MKKDDREKQGSNWVGEREVSPNEGGRKTVCLAFFCHIREWLGSQKSRNGRRLFFLLGLSETGDPSIAEESSGWRGKLKRQDARSTG